MSERAATSNKAIWDYLTSLGAVGPGRLLGPLAIFVIVADWTRRP